MSLPLKVRKNIKECEPKITESLERLNNSALGGEWSFDCDYENAYKLATKCRDPSVAEDIGSMVSDNFDSITRDIVRFIDSNPLKAEAVKESLASRKISYNIIDKDALPAKSDEPAWRKKFQAKVENGALVFQVAKGEYPAYIGEDFSSQLKTAFDEPGNLSLLSRVNIAESQEKLEDLKEDVKKATGQEFEVDFDFVQLTNDWKKVRKVPSKQDLDGLGDLMINNYLSSLVRNIVRLCEDEMSKEAFVEAVNKKMIRFQVYTRPRAEKDSFYTRSKIVDGALVVQLDSDSFPANCDETGYDLEKLL